MKKTLKRLSAFAFVTGICMMTACAILSSSDLSAKAQEIWTIVAPLASDKAAEKVDEYVASGDITAAEGAVIKQLIALLASSSSKTTTTEAVAVVDQKVATKSITPEQGKMVKMAIQKKFASKKK